MKYTLTKLLLKTRINVFYWVMLLLFILFGIYFSFLYTLVQVNNLNPIIINFIVIAISFISLLIFLISKISISKSDNDFLAEIPFKKNTVLKSFYILNVIFILPAIILLIILGEILSYGITVIITIFDMFLLSLLSINLAFIYRYLFKNRIKIVIPFIFIVFLMLPAFVKFDYSITSIFYGYILNGTIIIILLATVSFFYMIKTTGNINLKYKDKNMLKEIKSENLTGTPLRAMYMKNTYLINAIYFFNGFGKSKVYNKRLNIIKILVIMSVIGIIYFIINVIYQNTFFTLIFDAYIIIIAPLYYQSFTNSMIVPLERLWLSLTSMNNHIFVRNTILLNALSTFIGFIPLVIAVSIILVLYFNNVNFIIFIYILTLPYILSILGLYSSLLISPYQVKYPEEFQNFSIHFMDNLLRMIPVLMLFIVSIILAGIAIFIPGFIVYMVAFYSILLVLSIIMVNSKRLSNYVVKRLIHSNFI